MTIPSPGIYEHYKGKRYRVLGIAKHSETLEDLVVYEALYANDTSKLWVRPLSMFRGTVTVDGEPQPRFRRVPQEGGGGDLLDLGFLDSIL
jgi:hypothetical protein